MAAADNPTSVISVSISANKVTVGDTVTISYDVEDADGVASVSPVVTTCDPKVKRAEGSSYSSMAFRATGDTSSSFQIRITSSTSPGTYYVVGLTVQDKVGYETTFYDADFAANYGVDGPTIDLSDIYYEVASLKGDVNDNGVVNIVDAQIAYDLARGVYRGSADEETMLDKADVNDDGIVNAQDARAIQYAVHFGW